MAYTPPTTEPTSLHAGDTWQWRREDLAADYPAPTWTLSYYFRNATSKFAITASADGTEFAVNVAKATTAAYTVGEYDWVAFVDNGSERYQIDQGRLEVLYNYATDVVHDGRSFARQMLDAIEAALLSRASSDQLDLVNATLADRGISRDKAGLITLRNQFRIEVKREDAVRDGFSGKSRILARFG